MLAHIYLSYNEISNVSIAYLNKMLKNDQILAGLCLYRNGINNHGVGLLANLLANQSLISEWFFLNSDTLIDD